MRLKYEFFSCMDILLPYFYNEGLQALIYRHLFPQDKVFLHEKGFPFENRKFKFFTFSKILKKPKIIRKRRLFNFGRYISFILSSPVNWILEETAERFIKTKCIRFFRNSLFLNSIDIMPRKTFSSTTSLVFRTISPVTVYSTFKDKEKPFYYYSPEEAEFFIQIINNLKKKFVVYYGREYEGSLKLEILKSNYPYNKQVVWYKKMPITAWNFVFRMEATREMLYIAYYSGIGAKNSAGFGCLEEIRN